MLFNIESGTKSSWLNIYPKQMLAILKSVHEWDNIPATLEYCPSSPNLILLPIVEKYRQRNFFQVYNVFQATCNLVPEWQHICSLRHKRVEYFKEDNEKYIVISTNKKLIDRILFIFIILHIFKIMKENISQSKENLGLEILRRLV